MINVLMSIFIVVFTSCGIIGRNKNSDGSEQGLHKYEISASDAKGQKCSTGKKEFRSLNELCFEIQIDDLNNNCAQDLRKSNFDSQCKATEFSWHESRLCKIGIFDQTATGKLGGIKWPEQGRKFYHENICMGRISANGTFAGIKSRSDILFDDVSIVLDTHFSPLKNQNNKASGVSVRLYRTGSGYVNEITDSAQSELNVEKVPASLVKTTVEKALIYAISCEETAACK